MGIRELMIQNLKLFKFNKFSTTLVDLEKNYNVQLLKSNIKLVDYISHKIRYYAADEKDHDLFYINNVNTITQKYQNWSNLFPRIRPFFAVKSNNDPLLMETLRLYGAGFDCASGNEIELALKLGATSNDIVFANPCKRQGDLKIAKKNNVSLTTFDSLSELKKIKLLYPQAECLIRIRVDDPTAQCQLGKKYGALQNEIYPLLKYASNIGINVIGVSFHIGSGARDFTVLCDAIKESRKVFDAGSKLGFSMKTLDIGGGFTQNIDSSKTDCQSINQCLHEYFPDDKGYNIMAEPGRYFSETMSTLVCKIIGKKKNFDKCHYWITDGLYGSLNCVIYDNAVLKPYWISKDPNKIPSTYISCTIFGPTCDSFDVVLHDYLMPELEIDDWIVFPNTGAYCLVGATNFNGIDATRVDTNYIKFTQ